MKTRSTYFWLALCTVIMIGFSLTIAGGRGGSTHGGSALPPPPATGLTAIGTMRTTAGLAAEPEIAAAYGKMPLSFESNRGQTNSRVRFLSRGHGYGLFLTSTEAILSLGHATEKTVSGTASGRRQAAGRVNPVHTEHDSSPQQAVVLQIILAGANRAARVTGLDEGPGKANYFLGNDPKKWHTNVPIYGRVKYDNVYPGIDLIYYGNQQDLESDFVVAPGANPGAIRLKFRGTRSIRINSDGDLALKNRDEETLLRKPVAYQRSTDNAVSATETGKHFVAARYVLKGQREVGFAVQDYDAREPLIIDPVLAYSTYLGGSGTEFGQGSIAVDAAGNAYVAGVTNSPDFPTVNPFQSTCHGCPIGNASAFVTKLNAAGNALVYSTYLGGSAGAAATSIAVDTAGNAYVTGYTYSTDFPTANPEQATYAGNNDAFVTKVNPTGDGLVYSTYLGGSGIDTARAIAVDAAGNAYVTGDTFSLDFPTVNPFQATPRGGDNAFVTKFNAAGDALVYSTYLGGSSGGEATAIAVDASSNAYVTGDTVSTDFPTVNPFQATLPGSQSAFVTKFNAIGNDLIYSTYLGGSEAGPANSTATGGGTGIAVDVAGNAYVTGQTTSASFPTANPFQGTLHGQMNAFVTKFSAAGSALAYSTYLGGSCFDAATGIFVDATGNAYVAGGTCSTDFPLANPFQSTCGCSFFNGDAFVTQLNAAGNALVYSSYLGGSLPDGTFGIALDTAGNAYLAGTTFSTDFPTVNPIQTYGGNQDAYVAKISQTSDFAISSSAAAQTVSAGQKASFPLALAGSLGFSGTVSLACKSAPPASTCSIAPNSVIVSGTNASTATVTVATTARPSSSAGMIRHTLFPGSRLWTPLACIPALACVFIGATRRRSGSRQRARVGIGVVFFFTLLSFGCGGGSSSSGAQSGTPAGMYTLTVTGTSGTLTHTINLTLNVN